MVPSGFRRPVSRLTQRPPFQPLPPETGIHTRLERRTEREDLRHAYYRARIEMREMQAKAVRTGKTPCWYLEDDEDWTPVPMTPTFGGLLRAGYVGLHASYSAMSG